MISVFTKQGVSLMHAIRKAIEEKKVQTWRFDANNEFLTHDTASKQWDGKAWLKPEIKADALLFGICYSYKDGKKLPFPREIYAIFHGRFIEMLLEHFPTYFDKVVATSSLHEPDQPKKFD